MTLSRAVLPKAGSEKMMPSDTAWEEESSGEEVWNAVSHPGIINWSCKLTLFSER